MSIPSVNAAQIEMDKDQKTLDCKGHWTIANIIALESELTDVLKQSKHIDKIDGSRIESMDSAGALLLQFIINRLKKLGQSAEVVELEPKFQSLFNIVAGEISKVHHPTIPGPRPWLVVVGQWAEEKYRQCLRFLSFVGELFLTIIRSGIKPKRVQWLSALITIDETGYRALPIIALLSFLIGVVLAYQLGVQLQAYGADIYVADFMGISVFREFGPLLTAIILAGRTSTAFTALIGTMKVNEEIDALNTMGLSPIERLVLPRILGLLIVFPLLIVWADIFGLLGGMVMSKAMLHINYSAFIQRIQINIGIKDYILGLVKAPAFAMIIATVGCFQGFQVKTSATSVGHKTTQAAVQSLFLIIIVDAAFSVIFNWLGL